MGASRQHILVLDHEPVWLNALNSTLGAAGLNITTTGSATEALKLLRERSFAVVMVGIDKDRFDWERFLERAKVRAPACKLVVVSHQDPLRTVDRALQLGAAAYVVKRAEPEDLVFAVRQALSPGRLSGDQQTGPPARPPDDAAAAVDPARAGNPGVARRGLLERRNRGPALDQGADGEEPPLAALPEDRRP
jgi:Response regulator containing CheY-like receiver, AAA-type ATPase, and DNA-binding domains